MDHRREATLRRKHFDQRAGEFGRGSYGLWVDWYVYDADASVVDDLYNEDIEKVYKSPIRVPVLWATVSGPENELSGDGRRDIQHLNFAVTIHVLEDFGLDPDEVSNRLRDVIYYKGDYYASLTYDPRGHIGRHTLTETAPFTAVRRAPTDTPLDSFPSDGRRPWDLDLY